MFCWNSFLDNFDNFLFCWGRISWETAKSKTGPCVKTDSPRSPVVAVLSFYCLQNPLSDGSCSQTPSVFTETAVTPRFLCSLCAQKQSEYPEMVVFFFFFIISWSFCSWTPLRVLVLWSSCSHSPVLMDCPAILAVLWFFTNKFDNTAAFVSVPKFSLSPALQAVLWKTVPKFSPTVPAILQSLCPLWYCLYRTEKPHALPCKVLVVIQSFCFPGQSPFSHIESHTSSCPTSGNSPHYSCWQSLSFYWSMSCLCISEVLLTQHLARELTNEPWAIIQLCFIRQTLGGAVPPPEHNSDPSTGLGCATKKTPIIRQPLCRDKKKIGLMLL